jgi:proteasome accessory factor B
MCQRVEAHAHDFDSPLPKVPTVAVSKLERLLNLTALLLETRTPLTSDDIRKRLEGYPEGDIAFHRAFERDKEDLREMGIPVEVERLAGVYPPVDGYRIRKEAYYLADPGLDRDELAALHLAASAVRLGGMPALGGLLKLGGVVPGADAPGIGVGELPAHPGLPALFEAAARHVPVRFRYRGDERTVDPYRLDFTRGRWYVTGFDHLRDAERVYRVDRIEGDVVQLDGPRFDTPTTEVPGGRLNPWELGEGDPTTTRVLVDAPQASWAEQAAGPDAVAERREDGSVVIELEITNVDAFRSFVLGFLEHAEVLSPPELRADTVEWLRALSTASTK